MQQAPAPTTVTRNQVGKLILYITPAGDLAMVAGNQHMIVTAQEAQEHFDHLLGHAELFRKHNRPTCAVAQRGKRMSSNRTFRPNARLVQEFV